MSFTWADNWLVSNTMSNFISKPISNDRGGLIGYFKHYNSLSQTDVEFSTCFMLANKTYMKMHWLYLIWKKYEINSQIYGSLIVMRLYSAEFAYFLLYLFLVWSCLSMNKPMWRRMHIYGAWCAIRTLSSSSSSLSPSLPPAHAWNILYHTFATHKKRFFSFKFDFISSNKS